MNDSSTLCVSCGLCCDGTLIGFVQVGHEEMPAIRQLMEIEEADGDGFFLQPCNNLCDGCTIYANRPKQCASFKCELLKSAEQKELDADSALEVIGQVKETKRVIEHSLAVLPLELKSHSFYFKMVELKKLLQKMKSESSITKDQLELMSKLMQLDVLLTKNFGISLD